MANIEHDEIENYLLTVADIISDSLKNDNDRDKYNPRASERIRRASFNDAITSRNEKDLIKNHDLVFSDSYSAFDTKLLNDRDISKDEIPFDMSYYVKNYIVFLMGEKGKNSIQNPTLVSFDIDKFNRSTDGSQIGEVFIDSLKMKNISVSTAEGRFSYQVDLVLKFTHFEDLYASKDIDGVKFSPINLVYPFASSDGTTPDFIRDLKNPLGMIFQQELHYKNKDGKDEVIYKNYHVDNAYHEIEAFKADEAINNPFENQLTVTYVAHETNGSESFGALKTSANLYRLLDKYETLLHDKDKEFFKSYIDTYKSLRDPQPPPPPPPADADEEGGEEEEGEEVAPDTEEKKADPAITKIKTFLSFCILDSLPIYSIEVSDQTWTRYKQVTVEELVKKNVTREKLAEAAIEGAVADAGIALAMGPGTAGFSWLAVPQAAVQGAAFSVGFVYLNAAIEAKEEVNKDTGEREAKALIDIRNQFKKDSIKKHGKGFYNKKFRGFKVEEKPLNESLVTEQAPSETAGTAGSKGSAPATTSTAGEAVAQNAMNLDLAAVSEAERDSNAAQKVYFTTFGDLLGLVFHLEDMSDLRMLIGGYIMEAGDTRKFVNLLDIPIYINSLNKILKNKIVDSSAQDLVYMSNTFFNDCLQQIIHTMLKEFGGGAIQTDSSIAPKNVKNKLGSVSRSDALDKTHFQDGINLMDSFNCELFVKLYNADKNIINNSPAGVMQKPKPGKLVKVMKMYGEIYKSVNTDYFHGIDPDSSYKFQETVHSKYKTPCVLMRKVANRESFLKRKYVIFSREDDVDLESAVFKNNAYIQRKPYRMTADLRYFMSFILDVGSLIFVSPPIGEGSPLKNNFGFGGLYQIQTYESEYYFQRLVEDKLTLPNFESKATISAINLTPGNSLLYKQRQVVLEEPVDNAQQFLEQGAKVQQEADKTANNILTTGNPWSSE